MPVAAVSVMALTVIIARETQRKREREAAQVDVVDYPRLASSGLPPHDACPT